MMAILTTPLGQLAQATQAPPGRLLLWPHPKGLTLLLSTDYGQGEDKYHLAFSAHPERTGVILKSAVQEWVWDVTDIAHIEVDRREFDTRSDQMSHGTIAIDRDAKIFVGLVTSGFFDGRTWIGLDTLAHHDPAGATTVRFPRWALVTNDEKATTLFQWPVTS